MDANQLIRVLVATKSEGVYEHLNGQADISYDIALYTGSIKDLLPGAQLVIIDYGDLVEYPYTEVELREAILAAQVVECTSDEFLANPLRYFSELVANRPGRMRSLPEHYCIAFVSYSGGTGRTTLALDTALSYAEAQRRRSGRRRESSSVADQEVSDAMLVELSFGSSALVSVTGIEMPRLYALATDADAVPHRFKGVTVVPMDYENVRVLSGEYLGRYLARQIEQHGLTVVDATWPHSLAGAVSKLVDLWLVVANERPDTIANARRLQSELKAEFGPDRVWLVQNRVANGKSRAEKQEADWHLRLQRINAPDDWRGELGQPILAQVFAPVWEQVTRGRKAGS